MIAIIILVSISLLVWIAWEFYEVSKMKGFSEIKYFWISFLFPILGYLLVVALPDRNQKKIQVTLPEVDKTEKQTTSIDDDELPDI